MTIQKILNELNYHVWDTNGNCNDEVTEPNWSTPFEGQCVSLCKAYFKKLYGIPLNFGNAIDYYNNMYTNGILNYCEWITSDPQDGDIAVCNCFVWDGVKMKNFGHVMIKWGDGYLSQNVDMGYGPNPRATRYADYWHSVIIGWFRPNVNKIKNVTIDSNGGDEEVKPLLINILKRGTTAIKEQIYFDGEQFHQVKIGDEVVALKKIHKAMYGTELREYSDDESAQYWKRWANLQLREPMDIPQLPDVK